MKPVIRYRSQILFRKSYKPNRIIRIRPAQRATLVVRTARAGPVFGTGAASVYLPAFQKVAARVGLAPTPNGLTGRRAALTLPGSLKVALPAGVAPASFRLEGGCLMYSTTAAAS